MSVLPENEFWPLPAHGSSIEIYRAFVRHNKHVKAMKDKKQSKLGFKKISRAEYLSNLQQKSLDNFLRKTTFRPLPVAFGPDPNDEGFWKQLEKDLEFLQYNPWEVNPL